MITGLNQICYEDEIVLSKLCKTLYSEDDIIGCDPDKEPFVAYKPEISIYVSGLTTSF